MFHQVAMLELKGDRFLFHCNPHYPDNKVSKHGRQGITLLEVIVCIVILVVLAALLLPAVRTAREPARRMACSNNLKNIVLAVHNYEGNHRYIPVGWGGPAQLTDREHQEKYGYTYEVKSSSHTIGRWSPAVRLLPFLEQGNLYQALSEQYVCESGEVILPPIAPWNTVGGKYKPWSSFVFAFVCPSSLNGPDSKSREILPINYAFSFGDRIISDSKSGLPLESSGPFQGGRPTTFSDCSDGTSSTVAMGEILHSPTNKPENGKSPVPKSIIFIEPKSDEFSPRDCLANVSKEKVAPTSAEKWRAWRGDRWGDGAPALTGFTTNIPPNSTSCVFGDEFGSGYLALSSYHTGGVNVAMMDGSVQFLSQSIDCGNLQSVPSDLRESDVASPFGVWGALGTRNGHENSEIPE